MRIGALIAGRYRLTAPLGAGAMGQVWRARDERLQRDVAVKVVDLARPAGPVSAGQFEREALATARLNHPNIVTLFDAGADGDVAYLVMELLTGESLADRLARGPLPAPEAVRIATQVARALEATHLIGVVHLDVKPGNVMLTSSGGVKVLDFGIAQLAGDAEATESISDVIGTAAYMSPEQAQGRRAGTASDVYALGCLIVAMLAGRPPFLGATAVDVARQQIGSTPPRLRALRPDAPAGLDALVARMLAKDPSARPSAADVLTILTSPDADPTAVLPAVTTAFPPPTAAMPVASFPPPVAPGATAVMPSPAPAYAVPAHQPQSPVRYSLGNPPTAPRPGGPTSDRWFRRGLKWILLAMAALIALAAVGAGAQRLGTLVGGTTTPQPSPSTTKPTPTPTPTPSKAPTLPGIQLPTISLPTLPSAGEAALKAAVGGVGAALDAWSPNDQTGIKTKDTLVKHWATASEDILAGNDAQQALDDYADEVRAAHDKGRIPEGTYFTLNVAIQTVDLLV